MNIFDIIENEMHAIYVDLKKAKILDRKIDQMVILNRMQYNKRIKEYNDLQYLIKEQSWKNNNPYNNQKYLDSLKKELTILAKERDYLLEKQILVKEILRRNNEKVLSSGNKGDTFSDYNPFAEKEQIHEKIALEKQTTEGYLSKDCLDSNEGKNHENNFDPFSERKDNFLENKKETKEKDGIGQGQENDILKSGNKYSVQSENTNADKDIVLIDQDFFSKEKKQYNKDDIDVFMNKNDILVEEVKRSSNKYEFIQEKLELSSNICYEVSEIFQYIEEYYQNNLFVKVKQKYTPFTKEGHYILNDYDIQVRIKCIFGVSNLEISILVPFIERIAVEALKLFSSPDYQGKLSVIEQKGKAFYRINKIIPSIGITPNFVLDFVNQLIGEAINIYNLKKENE